MKKHFFRSKRSFAMPTMVLLWLISTLSFAPALAATPVVTTLLSCTDTIFCGYGDTTNLNTNQCVGLIALRPNIESNCIPANGLFIDYKIDLNDDGEYDLLGYSTNHGSSYPFPNPAMLPVQSFDAGLPLADGIYEVGTHRIMWTVTDDCGMTSTCDYVFEIKDCKVPKAICEIGISIIPLPPFNGTNFPTFVIKARDFNLGSSDNCTAAADLMFSFSDDITDTVVMYPPPYPIQQSYSATIYVWDEAGNYSTCLLGYILSGYDPEFNVDVNGFIKDENGVEIKEVEVTLNDGQKQETTGILGFYDFSNLPIGMSQKIEPRKVINPLNGVTTFDLILISKHILGINTLNSPYKIIAADVNQSGNISTFDMIGLRKLILGIDDAFPNSDSWRFVLEDYQFANLQNPFTAPFPEIYTNPSPQNSIEVNFIGMKIGDVNGSANLSNFTNNSNRYTTSPLSITTSDQLLRAGEETTIIFYTNHYKPTLGLQLALNFSPDAISIGEVTPGSLPAMAAENFGTSKLAEGLLAISWHQARAAQLNGAKLMTLNIRSHKDIWLSEALQLDANLMPAEIYTTSSESEHIAIHPLQLEILNSTTLLNCSDTTFCGYGDTSNLNANQCIGIIELRPTIDTDCIPANGLAIDYKIDLNDDGQYDLLGYSDNQGSSYPFPNPAMLPVQSFDAGLPQADGIYEVGAHRIMWTVTDSCGMMSTCDYQFEITDCVPPEASCEIGVSTIPIPFFNPCEPFTGFVHIFASDFDLGSTDNCTAAENLRFTYSLDQLDTVKSLSCNDGGQQFIYDIYVWDEAGNYSTCLVGVVVNGCSGQRGSERVYGGYVLTEAGHGINNVEMFDGYEYLGTTQQNGQYDLWLTHEHSYAMTLSKQDAPLNGVSTFDLVQISKHILGVQSLDSPYKRIAADVNRSGSITTFDMVGLRKLILGIDTEFRNNTSWRFLKPNVQFPGSSAPGDTAFANPFLFAFDCSIMEGHEYIGIKTGDVTGNADPSAFASNEVRDRQIPHLLRIPDQQLEAGEEYEIPVYANQHLDLYGFQFALSIDESQLELQQALAGELPNIAAANFNAEQGVLRASWHSPQVVPVSDQVLFYLKLHSHRNIKLSEAISIDNIPIAAEVYASGVGGEVTVHQLELTFSTNQSSPFTISPNPVADHFYLLGKTQEGGPYEISIHGLDGKLWSQEHQVYPNQTPIDVSSIPRGVYIITSFEEGRGKQTIKMIKL